jgi:transcriptional regulator NrdR family protein
MRHCFQKEGQSAQVIRRTAQRVVIRADNRATNLVDQKMMYAGISRAKVSAAVYTDDQAKLVSAINERAGERQAPSVPKNAISENSTKSIGAALG